MKRLSISLLSCLLLSFAGTAFAADGASCEAQANRLKASEREKFLKSCVAQLGSPAHIKEVTQKQKKATCEQNAKNKKLASNKKGDYVDECINKNEAAAAAAAAPQVAQASTKPATAAETKTTSKHATKQKKHNKKTQSNS